MVLSQFAFAAGARASRAMAALWRNRDGSVFMEYAFVAPPFFALLTGILYVSLAYVAQEGLETAAESAGRLFMTGQAQTSTVGSDVGMSAADFKNAICYGTSSINSSGATVAIPKMLPPFLTCGNLTTNVTAVASFSTSESGVPTYDCYGTACNSSSSSTTATSATSSAIAGTQNSIMVVQLIYNWRTFQGLFGLNLANENNGYRQMVATSVFTTEDYSCSAAQTSC